jgi:hypothetical protein
MYQFNRADHQKVCSVFLDSLANQSFQQRTNNAQNPKKQNKKALKRRSFKAFIQCG